MLQATLENMDYSLQYPAALTYRWAELVPTQQLFNQCGIPG